MTDQFITRMKVYDRIMRSMLVRHDITMSINPRETFGHWTPNYTVTPACAARLEQRR